ncbi:MAG: bifunctional phosphoribosylaminoimidazolecarboxamide formyltransferase/IMP cyclohydrolase [Hymenobacteraceae bacterium]|nr:bifunctional phosphoribosylaminoimidazolecarboxamide formyltransferase/IMP cyclohydrolase [Hymenobacteraceae bacterium]
MNRRVTSALLSVYHKDRLTPLVEVLQRHGVTLYSTGGTLKFLRELGADVIPVEVHTGSPEVFGGRVKTLHPRVFGGILQRRDHLGDAAEAEHHQIPPIDLVVVDLYPFEETVASGAPEADTIEQIDIGGISLLRAAAKNFRDVVVVSEREQYEEIARLLTEKDGATDLEDRRRLAAHAFDVTSHYDTAIQQWLLSTVAAEDRAAVPALKVSERRRTPLRYGENPHQRGTFYGDLSALFEQLAGKQLSYNNLVDVDAAVRLIDEFPAAAGAAVAIIKHTNACGVAVAETLAAAYANALACDPVSAFGGVIVANQAIDDATARHLHELFFEVLIAPDFSEIALAVLQQKKNRILLRRQPVALPQVLTRTLLNGTVAQDRDTISETAADFTVVTERAPSAEENRALEFALRVCKHTKSNTIVLARAGQLLASGVGQTSRVDALRQALAKAVAFGFDVRGAAMASDAFFPFPDCVEIAAEAGISAVVQPGGSIRDQDSIAAANQAGIAMVTTGVRHFLH